MEVAPYNESEAVEIGRSTANMASYIFVGKLVSFILGFIALVVVARILGPTSYGIYIIAVAAAGIAGSVGNFGIGTALNKFISEYKVKRDRRSIERILSDGIAILLIAGTILTIATFAASGAVARYSIHNIAYTYIIEVASLSVIASLLFGAIYSGLVGFGDGTHVASVSIIGSVMQYAISIPLVILGFGPVGPVIGLVLGQLIGFLACIYIFYAKGHLRPVMPSFKRMRKLMRFSNPLALSNVYYIIINNMSVVILGIFVASSIAGNFGIASKTGFLADLIVGSIGIAILPGFSSIIAKRGTRSKVNIFYNKALYISMTIISPFMFFLIFLSKQVSYTAFSSSYTLAPLYIAITAGGILLGIAGGYAGTLLISDNRTKEVLKYRGRMFLIQLVAMVFLIYFLHGLGLIILVFVLEPLLLDIFYLNRITKLYNIRLEIGKISRVILANIISFAIIYPIAIIFGAEYLYAVIASIAAIILVYPIVIVLIGGMNRDDTNLIRRSTSTMPIVGRMMSLILDYSVLVMPKRTSGSA